MKIAPPRNEELVAPLRQSLVCFWPILVVLAEKNVVRHFIKTCLL